MFAVARGCGSSGGRPGMSIFGQAGASDWRRWGNRVLQSGGERGQMFGAVWGRYR